MKNAFIVLKSTGKKGPEVQGVFTSIKLAKAACRAWTDGAMLVKLNKEYPRRTFRATWFHPQSNQVLRKGSKKWSKITQEDLSQ